MNYNKVVLIGRIGIEPEVKIFENGDKIANISLGVSDPYWSDSKEHWINNTSWVRCVFSDKLVDRVQELNKGDEILVEGKIKVRTYKDKNDENRSITEVKCRTFKKGMPGKISKGEEPKPDSTGPVEKNNTDVKAEPDGEDDLPF